MNCVLRFPPSCLCGSGSSHSDYYSKTISGCQWKSQDTNVASQGFLGLNNGGQSGTYPSSRYKGSAVPLVEVVFRVKSGSPSGRYGNVLRLGSNENPIVLTSTSSGGAAVNIDSKLGQVRWKGMTWMMSLATSVYFPSLSKKLSKRHWLNWVIICQNSAAIDKSTFWQMLRETVFWYSCVRQIMGKM